MSSSFITNPCFLSYLDSSNLYSVVFLYSKDPPFLVADLNFKVSSFFTTPTSSFNKDEYLGVGNAKNDLSFKLKGGDCYTTYLVSGVDILL